MDVCPSTHVPIIWFSIRIEEHATSYEVAVVRAMTPFKIDAPLSMENSQSIWLMLSVVRDITFATMVGRGSRSAPMDFISIRFWVAAILPRELDATFNRLVSEFRSNYQAMAILFNSKFLADTFFHFTIQTPNNPDFENPWPETIVQMPGVSCRDTGTFVPHNDNCNAYFACTSDQVVPLNCAPGLHFDHVRQVCDRPNNSRCWSRERSNARQEW